MVDLPYATTIFVVFKKRLSAVQSHLNAMSSKSQ